MAGLPRPMIRTMENRILLPTDFSPLPAALFHAAGGVTG